MLDDNVQLCHELDVGTGEGTYQPCSFTHVMNSLERLMLAENNNEIVVPKESDSQGTTACVRNHVNETKVRSLASPSESDLLRLEKNPRELPLGAQNIATVGDFCGRPGHYGVIGIERHGHGCRNNERTTEPFGVTHSVFSFCLLNVESTCLKEAWYPMKILWEDIEFNHIVDEKGLVVCKYRKFSHSKKNLQRLQGHRPSPGLPAPRPPPISFSAFQHDDIGLVALQGKYERGSNCLADMSHLGGLLEHISKNVLRPIHVEEVFYAKADNRVVANDGSSFEIEPSAAMTGNPQLKLDLVQDARSIVIMLLKGILNESFGVLKSVITNKVRVS